tara:strand:- start:110 stop:1321 length:1212 start_codon:yes stop_codon:yes gene_type:complete
MSKRLTREEVIKKFKDKHGDKYDYSKFVYKSYDDKGIVICPIHGEWTPTAGNHFKHGCPKCGFIKTAEKKKPKLDILIEKLKNVHGDRYDFSRIVYKGAHSNVDLVCKIHGAFQTTPSSLLQGSGCYKCGKLKSGKARFQDLTGKRFGKLTVLKLIEDSSHNTRKRTYWLVKCACGRKPFKVTKDMLSKVSRACNFCTRIEMGQKKARYHWGLIKNKKYGKLKIVRNWGSNKKGNRVVLADCDCGSQVIIPFTYLQSARSLSCGCIPSGTNSYKDFCKDEELANKETILYFVEVLSKYHKFGITYDLKKRSKGDYSTVFYERVLPRAKARAIEAIALRWTSDFRPKLTKELYEWGGSSELRNPMDLEASISMLDTLAEESEEMEWQEFWLKYGLTTGAEPQNT